MHARFTLSAVGLLLSMAATTSAETFESKTPEFRFEVPDGFVPAPRKPAGGLAAWVKADTPAGQVPIVIGLEDLDGTIGRESLAGNEAEFRKRFPEVRLVAIRRTAWDRYQVDVMESVMTVNGIEMFSAAAQIPVTGSAVQISVVGPEPDRESIRSVLSSSITSFHARSSWAESRFDRRFWLILWVCTLGYQMALLYLLAWFCVFRWTGPILLRTRIAWHVISVFLILGMAVAGQILDFSFTVSGRDTQKKPSSELSLAIPIVLSLPSLASFQRLREQLKRKNQEASFSPPGHAQAPVVPFAVSLPAPPEAPPQADPPAPGGGGAAGGSTTT